MTRLAPAVLLLPGCVIRATDPFGLGGDPTFGLDDVALEVDPSSANAGESALLTLFDANGVADFSEVYDVRPLGDFTITEYSVGASELTMVVEVLPDAVGEQPIAVDFAAGTVFASFRVF